MPASEVDICLAECNPGKNLGSPENLQAWRSPGKALAECNPGKNLRESRKPGGVPGKLPNLAESDWESRKPGESRESPGGVRHSSETHATSVSDSARPL